MTESFDRAKEFSKKYTIFIVAGLLLAVGLISTVIANDKLLVALQRQFLTKI